MIRKRPAVSAIVILPLGLGIGANGIFFASFVLASSGLTLAKTGRKLTAAEICPTDPVSAC